LCDEAEPCGENKEPVNYETTKTSNSLRKAEVNMKYTAILLLFSVSASAACPDGYPAVHREYSHSNFVFIGKAVKKRKTPESADGYFLDGNTYRVVPTHIYKGKIKANFDLFSENSTGRFPMLLDQEYLLFVNADHGRLMVDNCGNSDLVSHARKAVAQVVRLSGKDRNLRAR
jgi:hypothetical protein